MNPADVAQSVLPLTSSDLSLFTLFWNAHWVVKTVMVGLLVCSVWVWAIAIDKTVLYTRSRRAMDRFEQAFWSGQSLDELYRALSSRPAHSMAACLLRPCASGNEASRVTRALSAAFRCASKR